MGLIAKDSGGEEFDPCPAGTHLARCAWLIDIGTQDSPNYGAKRQCIIGWEMPAVLIPDGERKGEPYFLSKFYTLSLHEKANLCKDLEAWRGKVFTEDEREGFDLRNVVGHPCLLSVIHQSKEGKTKPQARIGGVMAVPSGTECPPAVNVPIVFDIDTDLYNQPMLDTLPEWVQKKVAASHEATHGPVSTDSNDAPPPADGDDIPF